MMIKPFISIVSAILLLTVFIFPLQAIASGSDSAGNSAKSAVKQKVGQKAGAKAPGPAAIQNSGPSAAKPGIPATPAPQGGSGKGPAVSPQKKIPTGPGQSASSQVNSAAGSSAVQQKVIEKKVGSQMPAAGMPAAPQTTPDQ